MFVLGGDMSSFFSGDCLGMEGLGGVVSGLVRLGKWFYTHQPCMPSPVY